MTILQLGDIAPPFETLTDAGHLVKLSDYRGQRVVLYFYPKDDTSGCTTQACGFRDAYPLISEKNAVVLGVSPDGVASHRKFKSKYNLPFTLLVDEEHRIAEMYGVWAEKKLYGRRYMGVIRSHFIIDAEGRIADVQYKISPTKSVDKALKSLAE
ncbi:MAG: thioredoxin-dependent thiol peroxidase [Chloroflexi bacterium]|nr:thioredoxin-dependent thiol peroxidase [Chloroflexota bacterium]